MTEEVLFGHVSLGRIRVLQRGRSAFDGTPFRPPTDVYETEETFVVVIEAAGLAKGTFEISLDPANRELTVTGRRTLPLPDAKVIYHQMEIAQGDFMVRVSLPWNLEDAAAATAEYDDGCLVINLPKFRARQVAVRHAGAT